MGHGSRRPQFEQPAHGGMEGEGLLDLRVFSDIGSPSGFLCPSLLNAPSSPLEVPIAGHKPKAGTPHCHACHPFPAPAKQLNPVGPKGLTRSMGGSTHRSCRAYSLPPPPSPHSDPWLSCHLHSLVSTMAVP